MKIAADSGDSEALFVISEYYHFGVGTDVNEEQAKISLLKSARQGNDNAKAFLFEHHKGLYNKESWN